jgi:TRAP transporter TAXI family solute receptor
VALGVAAVAAVLFAVFGIGSPFPPRTLAMTTGPAGGGYEAIGLRYQEVLARHGVALRLVPSGGARENLLRLRDPAAGVGVGLLAGGLQTRAETEGLVSLGTVIHEPLWVLCREPPPCGQLADLRGRRVSLGPEGSGARALALEILRRNGLEGSLGASVALAPTAAEEALRTGAIDCAFLLTSYEDSPLVQRLLADERMGLVSFPNADAHAALYPFLRKVVVPAGVGNLAKGRPAGDVPLLATTGSLVVRGDLHPTLRFLLMEAAEEIHSGPGILREAGRFPAAEEIDVLLAPEARQYYRSGGSFLQRHLPFWMWVLAARVLLVVVPLLAVAYPLARLLPALYGWAMRRRIVSMYGELRLIEQALAARAPGSPVEDIATALERLEEKADRARLPATYARLIYTLREHVHLVRARLRER